MMADKFERDRRSAVAKLAMSLNKNYAMSIFVVAVAKASRNQRLGARKSRYSAYDDKCTILEPTRKFKFDSLVQRL
jgi:hypothetical protein